MWLGVNAGLEDPRRRERVQTLVQPGVLELVVPDDAIPELVARLVNRDALRLGDAGRGDPAGAGGEQGRVLHATGAALPGRVDDGDLLVGVGTKPLSVVLQRGARRLKVTPRLTRVFRLQQQPHLHRGQPGDFEPFPQVEEVGAGGPGEVVDVLLDVAVRRGAIGVVARPLADAGRAEDPSCGDGDPDVVDSVVGEKLGVGVELVAVPAGVLEHAELRKPVCDEEEVSDGAGPGERSRHPRAPLELDVDRLARRDRRWHRHREHRPVVGIVVVR